MRFFKETNPNDLFELFFITVHSDYSNNFYALPGKNLQNSVAQYEIEVLHNSCKEGIDIFDIGGNMIKKFLLR
jgi:hypothetical protein